MRRPDAFVSYMVWCGGPLDSRMFFLTLSRLSTQLPIYPRFFFFSFFQYLPTNPCQHTKLTLKIYEYVTIYLKQKMLLNAKVSEKVLLFLGTALRTRYGRPSNRVRLYSSTKMVASIVKLKVKVSNDGSINGQAKLCFRSRDRAVLASSRFYLPVLSQPGSRWAGHPTLLCGALEWYLSLTRSFRKLGSIMELDFICSWNCSSRKRIPFHSFGFQGL